jgi:hypothetical protein
MIPFEARIELGAPHYPRNCIPFAGGTDAQLTAEFEYTRDEGKVASLSNHLAEANRVTDERWGGLRGLGLTDAERRARQLARCRTILELVHYALPASTRRDALDEWIDEIESAASADERIVGRTASIVLWAAPQLALRRHRPVRAHGNDS